MKISECTRCGKKNVDIHTCSPTEQYLRGFEDGQQREGLHRQSYLLGMADGAEGVSRWISVKDRMPLYKQCVLVYLDTEIITEAVYRGEYDKNVHIFRMQLTHEDTEERVTHWMPLPASPPDKK